MVIILTQDEVEEAVEYYLQSFGRINENEMLGACVFVDESDVQLETAVGMHAEVLERDDDAADQ